MDIDDDSTDNIFYFLRKNIFLSYKTQKYTKIPKYHDFPLGDAHCGSGKGKSMDFRKVTRFQGNIDRLDGWFSQQLHENDAGNGRFMDIDEDSIDKNFRFFSKINIFSSIKTNKYMKIAKYHAFSLDLIKNH